MDPTVSPVSLRGPKISKACEECRRRKQKCNGLNPCNVCTRRGTPCSYRTFIRRRAAARASAPNGTPRDESSRERSHPQPEDGPSSKSAEHEPNNADNFNDVPPRYQIYSSVRATHPHEQSPSCVLQLYYGSSSNFSFLQHLHAHFTAQEEGPRSGPPETEVQNGNPGLDMYKYQGLAFGSSVDQRGRDATPVFLRHDLAKLFLQNYLSTAHYYLPFLSPEKLYSSFEKLYGSGEETTVDPSERAIVLAAMAIGSCPTRHELWRKTLVSQARTEAESMLHIVNLRAVQVSLLMAHCESIVGRPNSAYLYLGSAVRKAFAAGLHRNSSNKQPTRSERSECNEASRTCWALFCYEQIICFSLGRPSSFPQVDIGIPLPEPKSFLAALVQMCEIIHGTQQMYNYHDSSPGRDLRACHRIRQRLRSFAHAVKDDLHITIGGTLERGEKLVMQTVLSYLYFNTLLLTFRPFLLLYVELKKQGKLVSEGHSHSDPTKKSPPWLLEACEYTAEAARSIVSLSEGVFSMEIGAEGIYNHTFFLESASFVLIIASLHDDRSTDRHVRYINRAIKSLRHMIPREPTLSVIAALEQMLAKVHALNGSAPQTDGSPINPSTGPDETLTLPPLLGQEPQGRENSFGNPQLVPLSAHPIAHSTPTEYVTPPGYGAFDMDGQAAGSRNDLLESEWPTMDWNFDLSTLDLESFVSVMGNQNTDLNYNI
ncbi:uncharacterized protein K452DRAFT_246627 [Aplosporella prunicola CBS 121167]|uniref:Zn(2)-C6 fungal-type domain-containing protein n=1 Tax=Aplosporella prunicola CBS 121167 TaxID=1176127 RepID=A0A6A6BM06_9PEZI|nr:uncharacterized protein K452DRAFT_246627 [Aplosporella prunicola CBS 121167]KAF2144314.1 hypothetical protein K452DRAFT_246627 [Aplosporella prunicola CBS 121167]